MTTALAAAQGFYAAAAGIFPLLLVVLVLGQERIIRTDQVGPGDWRGTALAAIFVTALIVFGEMAALRVLALGHDSFLLHGLTALALVYGFGAIFAQGAKLILLGRGDELTGRQREALGRLYALSVVVALLVSYAILWPELGLFDSDF